MTYVAAEARRELLRTVAQITDEIGSALAALGEAYEQLDENSADRLEETLFKPVQAGYGRARRTHAEFAARHRLQPRNFSPTLRAAARSPRELVETAVDAVAGAETALVTLQDSMKPVEVGDPELRAGLAEVRRLLDVVPLRAREFERHLGR